MLDLPAGDIYGVVNDTWMHPIKEIGSGKPEKLLLLGTAKEAAELGTAVQAYMLPEVATPPRTNFVKYTPKYGDKVGLNNQLRDHRLWELVNDYVQREPMAERDRFFYARLRELGTERGKDVKPSAKQKEVMQKALDVGMAMSQAISFNKTQEMIPTSLYAGDSGWEDAMAVMNPKIDLKGNQIRPSNFRIGT